MFCSLSFKPGWILDRRLFPSPQVISCDKSVCTLQITDTTGSHQFPAMQRLSISKGHAFILVFSVTSRQSLEELKPIYQQVSEEEALMSHCR